MNLWYVCFFWLVVFIHLETFAKSEQKQSPAENPENIQTSEGKPEPLPPRRHHVNYGDHGEAQPLSKIFDGFTTFTNKKSNLSDLLTLRPSWFWGRKIPKNNQLEQFHFPGTAFFRFHLSHQKENQMLHEPWNTGWLKRWSHLMVCFKPSINLGSTIPPLHSKQPGCFCQCWC